MVKQITEADVQSILYDMLSECEFFGSTGKNAEDLCGYASGMLDLAHEIIKKINE